ncbi:MAG: dihydropteroate synthase [Terrimicrobiaceae bacterium]
MTIMKLQARGRMVEFPRRPLVMGIVNINDDSFSGDGRLDSTWALARAAELVSEGADIIDVGGESARTNRRPVSEEQEWARIRPFVEMFRETMLTARPRDEAQLFPPLLSINTWRPAVARWSLEVAGDILNDMSALPDDTNARICAETGAALLIMHSVGEPKVAHTEVTYRDVVADVAAFFEERIRIALQAGVARDQILLDPGIDFAKQMPDNLRIYRELGSLSSLGRPILLPVSRKGVIGRVLGISDPAARDAGTVACIVAGCLRGASIFRVHNVDAAWHTIRTIEAVS